MANERTFVIDGEAAHTVLDELVKLAEAIAFYRDVDLEADDMTNDEEHDLAVDLIDLAQQAQAIVQPYEVNA